MSWLFSQALAADYLPAECLDGEPSALSNGTTTPAMHLSHGKTTEALKLSRFGLTCKPLMDDHGAELLMSYLAGFPVKTSAQPEKARVSTANAPVCGATLQGSLAKYDPATHSLKTAQCSFLEGLTELSVTLPAWGMTHSGGVYLQPKSARITGAIESGLWQTPTSTQVPPRSAASWAKKQTDREATGRYTLPPGTLEEQVGISGVKPCWDYHKSPVKNNWATPTTMDKLPPKSETALMREMTIARPGRSQPANLRDQVSNAQNWPAPTANNYEQSDIDALLERRERVKISTGNGNGFGLTLGNAVAIAAKYPTPCSTDHKGAGQSGDLRDRLDYAIERGGTKSATYEQNAVGQLSPDWVELLMGWPLGWTNLDPLKEGEFNNWLEGFTNAERNKRNAEELQKLRQGNDSHENKWEAGGLHGFSEKDVLQSDMRELTQRGNSRRVTLEGKKTQEEELRILRDCEAIASPSCGRDEAEQHTAEHTNTVHSLPQIPSRYGVQAWVNKAWEAGIERTVSKLPHRAARIKCIGNGQVPQCAATAFVILADRLGVQHG